MPKPRYNVVVLGDDSVGKSSTIAKSMIWGGCIDRRTIERYDLLTIGNEKGKLDVIFKLFGEMQRYGYLPSVETSKYSIVFTEIHEHTNYVTNIISGSSTAECGLLVVSAVPDEYEAMDYVGTTKEYTLLAYGLVVKKIVVAINKMDDKQVGWSEDLYLKTKQKVLSYLETICYDQEDISFVPISALTGDNLASKSVNMPWWQGPTLIEELALKASLQEDLSDSPLRIPIRDVYKVPGIGTVLSGKVESGQLKSGSMICFSPSGLVTDVRHMEMGYEAIPQALPGDVIEFGARRLKISDIRRGYVCGDTTISPLLDTDYFIAQITILCYPEKIMAGISPAIYCHTAQVECRLTELIVRYDRKTGNSYDNPQFLSAGDFGIVRLDPIKPVHVECFDEFPALGRFVVRHQNQTVAIGFIMKVVEKSIDT